MEDKYIWKEEYNTGVEFIDEQHKYFFNIITSLEKSISGNECRDDASKIFFSLVHYAEHFLIQEEIYLRESDFPGLKEHKELHAGFIKRIIRFQEDYENAVTDTCKSLLPFLDEWFNSHILKYDREAVDYMKEKGL